MSESIVPLSVMNTAIKAFGTEIVIEYIRQFNQVYQLPIVSVGSGQAGIEYLSQQMIHDPRIDWVCIDPDPLSFHYSRTEPIVYIQPEYPLVRNLIKAQPELVRHCTLFLNWCYPAGDYDYEAIVKLKPLAFMTIYNQDGIAGTPKFHDFVNRQTKYHRVHRMIFVNQNWDSDELNIVIEWYQIKSKQLPLPEITLPTMFKGEYMYISPL